MSKSYCVACHDYAIFKTELPTKDQIWFDDHHLHVDLGFLGICKDYPAEQISIPFKKSKNHPLTEEQKLTNKQRSSLRVKVEHAIGGLKRYRFLSDRLRCRNAPFYDLVTGICAGLWNFCLTN